MVVAGAVQTVADVGAAVVLVFAVLVTVSVWRTVRAARRRWSRWRTAVELPRQLRRAPSAVAAVASVPVHDPQWWIRQRDRHRMWRAVSTAERAVAVARRADAPIGDLGSLTRRLRRSASGVDALLRADDPRPQVRRQVADVVAAAHDIHDAATDALLAVASPETTGLLDAVRVEVTALRHGLATARR